MIGSGVLSEILRVASYAPSGDNAQPWRFVCSENTIDIYNIPDRDPTLYNFRQRGSYIGHGALIENIVIAAAATGFGSEIIYFPGPALCTARIKLTPTAEKKEDPLYDAIQVRSCNRKPYDKVPLGPRDHEAIEHAMAHSNVTLKLIEEPDKIALLAKAISINERIVMEHRGLHDFLFSMIRWSKKEEHQNPGLFIKTMEFPAPIRFMLKYVFSHWVAVTFFNKFGFSKKVPEQSGALYVQSSAIAALIIDNEADHAFLEAGRALQRVWLTATVNGLSMQPITAIAYLAQRVDEEEANMFSKEHRDMIRFGYDAISRIFLLRGGQRIALIFRIGHGSLPSATSYKLSPVIEFAK